MVWSSVLGSAARSGLGGRPIWGAMMLRSGSEAGFTSALTALIALPVFFLILFFAAVVHERHQTAAVAQDGVEAAARAAAISENAAAGEAAARASLSVTEATFDGDCRWEVDVSQWQAGAVEVSGQCDADLSYVPLLSPSSYTVDVTWVEPVDSARRIVRPG